MRKGRRHREIEDARVLKHEESADIIKVNSGRRFQGSVITYAGILIVMSFNLIARSVA